MKIQNIAFIVPCLALGGAEKQISIIAPRIKKYGHNVIIISLIRPKNYTDHFNYEQIEVFSLNMYKGKYNIYKIKDIISILKAHKTNVVITFNYPANILGRFIKLLNPNLKLITSIRSSRFGSIWRDLIMSSTKNIDNHTIPNSFNVSKLFVERRIINETKLTTIPNIYIYPNALVDNNSTINYRRNLKIEYGIGEKEFIWLAVGRHEKAKDYPKLIKAIKLLTTSTKHNFHLIIVGGGSKIEETRKNVEDMSLQQVITIIGEQKNVDIFYSISDAFVSSSAWEGMSNALIEAMAYSLPCVTTNVGDVNNIIKDNVSGMIVEPNNELLLSERMIQVMNMSFGDRKSMGISAKETIANNFSPYTIIPLWNNIICK